MKTNVLAEAISKKLDEEFSIVNFSGFCDECDIDHVEMSKVEKVIEDVIIDYFQECMG